MAKIREKIRKKIDFFYLGGKFGGIFSHCEDNRGEMKKIPFDRENVPLHFGMKSPND